MLNVTLAATELSNFLLHREVASSPPSLILYPSHSLSFITGLSHQTTYMPPVSILVSHREVVQCPPRIVWGLLLEKIRNPAKFVPGVTNVEVVKELGEWSIERKMTAPTGNVIHEFIGADPTTQTVIFRNHESDPMFYGFVTNTVLPIQNSEDTCILDFTFNWTAKEGVDEAKAKEIAAVMPGMIPLAVKKTKEHAEEVAKGMK